ncbi:D-alanyl-D-alanine carboxypeptidase DacB precursor [compost metagenome]
MNRAVEISAKSAICVLLPTMAGAPVVLYEKDAERVMQPASLIKLLTAITALKITDRRCIPLSHELKVIASDDAKGSGCNVWEGDSVSLRDSMANLLLVSSNVTANAIARTFGELLLGRTGKVGAKAVDRFDCEMNSVAVGLRMTRSRVSNPHGLAVRQQRSSARDLSLLVCACLDQPLIMQLWGLDEYNMTVAGSHPRNILVKHSFKPHSHRGSADFAIPQFIGGKTGTLYPDNFHLATVSTTRRGHRLISVTLGSSSLEYRYLDYLIMMRTVGADL